MSFIVAIDGPAGAGKGTISSALAKKFNLFYLDTGVTYRCVTLYLLDNNIEIDNLNEIENALKEIKIDFKKIDGIEKVFLNGRDVTDEIRKERVTNLVSQVASIKEVRMAMVEVQRKICKNRDSILEGRDIGTKVFPDADVKIYLDASVDERVKRRIKQNKEKGIDMTEEEVRKNVIFRDNNDKSRDVDPLRQAEDAIYIDATNYSINGVVRKVSKIIKKAKIRYNRIQSGYVMTEETTHKKITRFIVKHFLSGIYHIVYRVKKNGLENINGNEGIIICANHVNYIDAAGIVLLNKRYIRFVGKHDLYRIGIISFLGHLFNIIPVKRDSSDIASLKMCLKSLKNNEALGIFPEGTRKGMEKNAEIKNGAAYLAYKAKVKVVPVGIKGTFKPFTKIEFNYGKPIDISKYKTDDPQWLNNATKAIMERIIELSQ